MEKMQKEQEKNVILRAALALEAKLLVLHDSYDTYHKNYSPEALKLYAGFGNFSDAVHRIIKSGQLDRLPSDILHQLAEYSLMVSDELNLGVRMESDEKDHEEDIKQSNNAETNGDMYCHARENSVISKLVEGLSVNEQICYLKNIVNKTYDSYQDKAIAAKVLRDEMRENNSKAFNLDGIINTDEVFFNEELRDFLNTSDTGDDYTLSDMDPNKGWHLRDPSAAKEHQYGVVGTPNIKYVNDIDGREAVFSGDGELIKSGINKGTYNYAKDTTSWHSGWTSFGEHGRWDMDPFFRQYGITPMYRSAFGHDFYRNDYGTNHKINTLDFYGKHH